MWSSPKISNEFLHTGKDCIEGDPPGTINAAFVLWATQLDQVRVHSDEFATGTARRVVVSQRKGWQKKVMNRYMMCNTHSNETGTPNSAASTMTDGRQHEERGGLRRCIFFSLAKL